MRVTEYECIQLSSTSATHVYINPDVGAAHYLAERLRERFVGIQVNERNRHTIAELLKKNPAQNLERRFTCLASVVEFLPNRTWFYRGCTRCNKRLSRRSDMYVCGLHPHDIQLKLIYCIGVTIADDTGSTTVTLFDSAVISLVKTNCAQMVLQQGYSDPFTIPEPIHAIKGATTVFELQFNNRAQQGSITFIANQVIGEPQLLTVTNEAPQDPPIAPAETNEGTLMAAATQETPNVSPEGDPSIACAAIKKGQQTRTNIISMLEIRQEEAHKEAKEILPPNEVVINPATPSIPLPVKRALYNTPDLSVGKKQNTESSSG